MALGTCCLVPSPCPLPQSLILVAAAPAEKNSRVAGKCLVPKPAPIPPSSSSLREDGHTDKG